MKERGTDIKIGERRGQTTAGANAHQGTGLIRERGLTFRVMHGTEELCAKRERQLDINWMFHDIP